MFYTFRLNFGAIALKVIERDKTDKSQETQIKSSKCNLSNLWITISQKNSGDLKAQIHGATLRAILRATSVTRRGYTVATFRATLRAILDQRLPSSHAMMFTSRNPKWRRLEKKKSFRSSCVDALRRRGESSH